MTRRIAVLGAGAIGSSAGADLTRAGHDVTLVDPWPAHVEAMRAGGLRVAIKGGAEFHVPVRALHLCDLASARLEFDIVLLASKSNDARWLAELIRPYLAPTGWSSGCRTG